MFYNGSSISINFESLRIFPALVWHLDDIFFISDSSITRMLDIGIYNKSPDFSEPFSSGERGIRTPGGVTLNGFQDRRNRPLCHLSCGLRVQS